MAAVAVTEPDYGSDVAGLKVTATPADGPGRGARLRDQRRQDVVHVRRPRRRADAARPHRSRPLAEPPRAEPVHRAQAARRGPRLRVHPGRAPAGKMEGRPIDTIGYRGMHSYEVALEDWWVPADHLIGGDDGPRARLLLPDGGLRERPAADRGAGHRRDAGGLRGGPRLRPQPQRVRLEHRRLPADPGQARADGRAHPGRPAVQLPRRHADGQGPGRDRGQHGQGLRVQGRRVGHPRGDADPRWLRLRRGVHASAACSSTPACCRSSRAPTRRCASR